MSDLLEAKYDQESSYYTIIDIYQEYWLENLLDFDIDCQRNYIWNESQQQGFIDTLIYGEVIPQFHIVRYEGAPILSIIDGKQRLLTIIKFLSGEIYFKRSYADEKCKALLFGNKHRVYFDDLPQDLQRRIKRKRLDCILYNNPTPEEIQRIFRKLNAGQKLTDFQKSIAMNINVRKHFSAIIENNENLSKVFTNNRIKTNSVERACVSALGLILAHENNGEFTPLDLQGEALFDKNKNPYFFMYEGQDSAIQYKTLEYWEHIAKRFSKWVDILSEPYWDKLNTNMHQLWITFYYAYIHKCSDEEVVDIFTRLKEFSPDKEIGITGTAYSKNNMEKIYNYVFEKYLKA